MLLQWLLCHPQTCMQLSWLTLKTGHLYMWYTIIVPGNLLAGLLQFYRSFSTIKTGVQPFDCVSCWSHSDLIFLRRTMWSIMSNSASYLWPGELSRSSLICIKADLVHWLLRYACWEWVRRLFISTYFQMWSSLATFSKANGAMKCLQLSLLHRKLRQTHRSRNIWSCRYHTWLWSRDWNQSLHSQLTDAVSFTRHSTKQWWSRGTLQRVLRCLSSSHEWMTLRKRWYI